MIPLLWVLFIVILKGLRAVTVRLVVDALPARRAARTVCRRGLSRHLRHPGQAFIAAIIAVPLGIMVAIYLVEYGRGRLARTDDLSGRRARRHPFDRRCPVHLQRLDHHTGFPAERVRRVARAGLADAARGHPLDRGDAAPGPQRSTRGVYALGIPKWKTILRIVVAHGDCPASSVASCSRWPE